jgi:hypothetical protein
MGYALSAETWLHGCWGRKDIRKIDFFRAAVAVSTESCKVAFEGYGRSALSNAALLPLYPDIAWISENTCGHLTYKQRHGLIKGMIRRGGLGWLPQFLNGPAVTAEHPFWNSHDFEIWSFSRRPTPGLQSI